MVDDITADVVERVDGVNTNVGVDETVGSSVEMVGLDESPNAKDVDDCAGNDEAVVVELVNLLSTHGCLATPSCLALSPRLSGPAAEVPANQRRSKKKSEIRILKKKDWLFSQGRREQKEKKK